MPVNLQALLPYLYDAYCGLIIAYVMLFGKSWPIDRDSKIMKLCDIEVAKESQLIAYSLTLSLVFFQ